MPPSAAPVAELLARSEKPPSPAPNPAIPPSIAPTLAARASVGASLAAVDAPTAAVPVPAVIRPPATAGRTAPPIS